VTLRDAGGYIAALPKAKQERQEWHAATEALIMAAEDRGPLMHAHTGMLRALNLARSLRFLGAVVIHFSAVLDALVKVSLRILAGSLCAPRGGISDDARGKCLDGQRFALFGEFDCDGRGTVRHRPSGDEEQCCRYELRSDHRVFPSLQTDIRIA
jgi:hypothetical protein